MTTVGMWKAALQQRMANPDTSTAIIGTGLGVLARSRKISSRPERLLAATTILGDRALVERIVRDEKLAVRASMLLSATIDGPSSQLFREQYTQQIRNTLRTFCSEAETRVVHLSLAAITISRVNEHVGDQLEALIGRLIRQLDADAATIWYTEREIRLIGTALARFGLQIFHDFVAGYRDKELYCSVLRVIMRRYQGRPVIEEAACSAFTMFGLEDRISLAIAAKGFSLRSRAILLGCFAKAHSHNRSPNAEEMEWFRLLIPHFSQPELIKASHSHIGSSFAYSLGSYVTAYQQAGEPENAQLVINFAKLFWNHTPPNNDFRDRSYATRLALLTGVPWLEPSEEELRRAIAPLRRAHVYNVIPALRGLRSVASKANAPRDELRSVVEHIVLENVDLVSQSEVKFILRQLSDPRIPVTTKAVEKVMSHVQTTSNFDADDLSMIARLVNHHAPQEYHQSLLKEVVRQFSGAIPSSATAPLSLVTLYDIVLRNGSESRNFFSKATECNKLVTERLREDTSCLLMGDLANSLHFLPLILGTVRPLMNRVKEVREFVASLFDLMSVQVVNMKQIPPVLARRILTLAGWIAIIGTPGKNVNLSMRPLLQHLMKHHVVTGHTLSGFTKALTQLYRATQSTHEMRRLFPVLNLYCTVILRNQFIMPPITASFAISLILKRGSVTVEPVNRSHQETLRVCANIITSPNHKDALEETTTGHSNVWLSELLGNGHLLDAEARLTLLEFMVKRDISVVLDNKGSGSVSWTLSKGDMLWLS